MVIERMARANRIGGIFPHHIAEGGIAKPPSCHFQGVARFPLFGRDIDVAEFERKMELCRQRLHEPCILVCVLSAEMVVDMRYDKAHLRTPQRMKRAYQRHRIRSPRHCHHGATHAVVEAMALHEGVKRWKCERHGLMQKV